MRDTLKQRLFDLGYGTGSKTPLEAITYIEQLERERDEEGINHLAWKLEAEATQANLIKCVEVMKALREDMLERSRAGMDTIHGNEYRIVNAGRTAWVEFCAVLAELERKEGA